ncbi:uncharacterized protein BDR25DRAFT_353437 [Lindgomyces ingoldianus]|uniref:Uncharacterized protein n=1 Tax=Lindgomyces ingoldianus TaxID=673940 RepID=A0ACB6QZY7_9PLEO|nr:uncharacterized protein BDR25DRAFT_353437 [Lindgomyces ingoldianus]KAF2472410.1 hypothetical protein BDR25DRAFT_353437 [Lindgomyces ingoldianus]
MSGTLCVGATVSRVSLKLVGFSDGHAVLLQLVPKSEFRCCQKSWGFLWGILHVKDDNKDAVEFVECFGVEGAVSNGGVEFEEIEKFRIFDEGNDIEVIPTLDGNAEFAEAVGMPEETSTDSGIVPFAEDVDMLDRTPVHYGTVQFAEDVSTIIYIPANSSVIDFTEIDGIKVDPVPTSTVKFANGTATNGNAVSRGNKSQFHCRRVPILRGSGGLKFRDRIGTTLGAIPEGATQKEKVQCRFDVAGGTEHEATTVGSRDQECGVKGGGQGHDRWEKGVGRTAKNCPVPGAEVRFTRMLSGRESVVVIEFADGDSVNDAGPVLIGGVLEITVEDATTREVRLKGGVKPKAQVLEKIPNGEATPVPYAMEDTAALPKLVNGITVVPLQDYTDVPVLNPVDKITLKPIKSH